jgi:hypothetical protein
MHEVTDFPQKIIEEPHLPVTARDGTTLSVRVWRPIDAEHVPVPGILEAIPYRKRDLMAHRDSIHQPYLAGHGFAGVRLDLRGTGDSEGVLTDEYTAYPLPDDATVETVSANGVPAEWVSTPSVATGSGVLFFQGGGFVIAAASYRELCSRIARASGAPC